VLIGSTERMGAGTNVQERLVGLHHGDVTWKPSDIEQREGRIIRQGNRLLEKYGKTGHNGAPFEADILAYATERTVDAKMWDLNSTKLKMVNGVRKYNGAFNMEFEDEDSVSMAEMAALASGDPLLLERVKLTAEIDKLELLERAHRRKMFGIEDSITAKKRVIRDYPELAEKVEAAAKEVQTEINTVSKVAAQRTVTVEGKPYNTGFDAMRAANTAKDVQQAGNDNAKYSINIDGKQVTNKDGVEEAIHAALGDQRPFEATVDGNTLTRRAQLAHVLYDKINPLIASMAKRSIQHLNIGSMLNADIQVSVNKSDKYFDIGIALVRKGKTLAANNVHGEEYKDGYSLQAGRGLIDRLEGDIDNVARSTGDYYREKVKEAEHTLPPLLKQTGQPFKDQAELNEKRGHLEAVIRELEARAKAAEERHKHTQPAAEGDKEEEGEPDANLSAARPPLAAPSVGPSSSVAHGPEFVPDPSKPLGGQAQMHVLRRGDQTKREHMVVIDGRGRHTEFQGTADSVTFDNDFVPRLNDPNESLVLHHNHPDSDVFTAVGILSPDDLYLLGRPGVKAIWAHGQEGNFNRAELTDKMRDFLAQDPRVHARIMAISKVVDQVHRSLVRAATAAVKDGKVSVDEVNDFLHQIRNQILHDAGVIDLHHNHGNTAIIDHIKRAGMEPLVKRITQVLKESLFNEQADRDFANSHPPAPLVHGGDLGTLLGAPEDISRQYRQAPSDTQRPVGLATGKAQRKAQRVDPRQGDLFEGISHPEAIVGLLDVLPRTGLSASQDLFSPKHDMQKKAVYGLPLNPLSALEQLEGCSFCVSYGTRKKLGRQLDDAIRANYARYGYRSLEVAAPVDKAATPALEPVAACAASMR
jgi:hypothetical protein